MPAFRCQREQESFAWQFMLAAYGELVCILFERHQALRMCCPSAKNAVAYISNCYHALGVLARAVQKAKPVCAVLLMQT